MYPVDPASGGKMNPPDQPQSKDGPAWNVPEEVNPYLDKMPPDGECQKQSLYNVFLFLVILVFGVFQVVLMTKIMGLGDDLER